MSKAIGLWFAVMMVLGFACLYAGDATKGSSREWVAPASPDMRAQLSPLMTEADTIDAAAIVVGQQEQAVADAASAHGSQRWTVEEQVRFLNAQQQKMDQITPQADALEQQADQIRARAEALREQARLKSETADAQAAGAVAGYADRLRGHIGANDAGRQDPRVRDARDYAQNFLRLPSPDDRWRRLWSQRSAAQRDSVLPRLRHILPADDHCPGRRIRIACSERQARAACRHTGNRSDHRGSARGAGQLCAQLPVVGATGNRRGYRRLRA